MTLHIRGRDLTNEEIQQEIATHGHIRSAAEIQSADAQLEMRRIGMMLLSHPDGKLLMDTLEKTYYRGSMLSDTPEKTYFNLGQREVVEFLMDLRDRATKEK